MVSVKRASSTVSKRVKRVAKVTRTRRGASGPLRARRGTARGARAVRVSGRAAPGTQGARPNLRLVPAKLVTDTVAALCKRMAVDLSPGYLDAMRRAVTEERSETGIVVLNTLLQNAELAKSEGLPTCQDTGVTIVHVKAGADVHIEGASLEEAVNAGVRRGYEEGYLRMSVVGDPLLQRVNTKTNTPAVMHYEVVPGDRIWIRVMEKGTGAENMSQLKMLTPAGGVEGVKDFVMKVVDEAGPNACPPLIVGVGIGGTFDQVGWLAKKAVMRVMGARNADPRYAALEEELRKMVNTIGSGPQGLGGVVTALEVRVEVAPCHIGALPVAVNLECHAHRVQEVTL
ncbi:MAG TPA: fumarate hydratase [Candidatus Thermoplasmatota archaeon]|nr:fumarate hydratase [Candidatus Thermoplasmatota archaeon]